MLMIAVLGWIWAWGRGGSGPPESVIARGNTSHTGGGGGDGGGGDDVFVDCDGEDGKKSG